MRIESWGGARILFQMAAAPEYGPHLQARIQPLITGIGPIEAAVVMAATLEGLARDGGLPDLVVSLGSAGAARLEHCAVYQASHVAYRDMDASALGFEKGATPLLDLPAIQPLAPLVPGLALASLSTGANVVTGAGYDTIAQDMVDMESFAVLRACQRHGLPLIALRGISDGATPLEGLHSWTEYLHIVDENLALALDHLRAALEQGLPL
ncbi:5'-methylthioadenosine/S-adenosylhomocysteine nucleosidase [Roseibaca sp. V10]|uniref:5'-methylthioadenosine/S-adenosylhomocysteine nucleosidase n=1 Tax=Roseinatronobacter domitianus TaxID=2940293 RepID=A0ABT0M1I7_9RHOB|nr:5'-methylthioadenosine/S-adenosylhomocysteine nucleosidase [Roseibaca domitiana]MCL1628724.1 5'-methylthioadenosine/S-adenosylhomocysteine nucleosidase [Roseibaca domitiana]